MLTITEALAEIKTIAKRISGKQKFIKDYSVRYESIKDPLEKDGGSVEAIKREWQAISDLELRLVSLRMGIQRANEETKVAIEGVEKSIAEWLIWRREISSRRQMFLNSLGMHLTNVRDQVRRQGSQLYPVGSSAEKPTDAVANLSEYDLAQEVEKMDKILGQLDGQLSLKNATVMVN